MTKASRLCLVSCVSKKRPNCARAADLYISTWFRKVRRLIDASGAPWFILSAEHGLLSPDAEISWYNRTLNKMSSRERRAWADRVKVQMDTELPDVEEVVVLAGERYRENLMPYLRGRFSSVSVPMAGLAIGHQLHWLDNATDL